MGRLSYAADLAYTGKQACGCSDGCSAHPLLQGLRQLLGLRAGDRLALSLEPDGLHLAPQGPAKAASAHALIGAAHYEGEPVPLERMDPALYASRGMP
jgi:hypothetical protein